jgi:hypothetical protein
VTDEQRLPQQDPDGIAPSEEPRPRRYKPKHAEEPAEALGYRASRRSSKVAKKVRRKQKFGRLRSAFSALVARVGRSVAVGVVAIGTVALAGAILWGGIAGINAGARWYVKRRADEMARATMREKVRENLLVIGVAEKQATGFLAMRIDRKTSRVFGIAIPEGAFVEVPGQGFERIGDSYKAGPEVSMSAVSNYLSVPFDYYVVVPDDVYKDMLKRQSVTAVVAASSASNLGKAERRELDSTLRAVPGKNIGLAPLPVRSISIGSSTYYEPQRDQIADLLFSWWGVKFGSGKQALRLIIYNGSGSPGIGGSAARQLIRAGFRVVDTGNADRFDYATTQIVVFRGDPGEALRIRDILGAGAVVRKPADQNITDVIVVIGRDYRPPK